MTALFLCTAEQGIVRKWQTILENFCKIDTTDVLENVKDRCNSRDYELIIIDHALLEDNFSGWIAELQRVAPQAKILLLGNHCSPEVQIEALSMGISGYMESDIGAEILAKGIDRVLQGEAWVERQIVSSLLENLREKNASKKNFSIAESLATLTPRELEIARQICQGESNKRVAIHLDITEGTVKAHLSSIFRKLKVTDRLQLALLLRDCFSE